MTLFPVRSINLLWICKSRTVLLQPFSMVLYAYQIRSSCVSSLSSNIRLMRHGICATTCCTISKGQLGERFYPHKKRIIKCILEFSYTNPIVSMNKKRPMHSVLDVHEYLHLPPQIVYGNHLSFQHRRICHN